MGLNIKNVRVHALAREAAVRTGRTQTAAIELALQRLLDGLDDGTTTGRVAVDRILADVDIRLADEHRARLRTDDLYDEAGLPR